MRKIRIVFLLLLIAVVVPSQARLKVGLVLGGGGAKGAAEVGALRVIEETGIPIDYIAGTSIGSIIGGLYACGYRSADLDSLFRNEKWMKLFGDDILNLVWLAGHDERVAFFCKFPEPAAWREADALGIFLELVLMRRVGEDIRLFDAPGLDEAERERLRHVSHADESEFFHVGDLLKCNLLLFYYRQDGLTIGKMKVENDFEH